MCKKLIYFFAAFSFLCNTTCQDVLLFYRMIVLLWLLSNLYTKCLFGETVSDCLYKLFLEVNKKDWKKNTWIQSLACPDYKLFSIIQHWLDTHSDLSKTDSDTPAGDDIFWGQNTCQIRGVFKYDPQKNSELAHNWRNNRITPNYVCDHLKPLPFTKHFEQSWTNQESFYKKC